MQVKRVNFSVLLVRLILLKQLQKRGKDGALRHLGEFPIGLHLHVDVDVELNVNIVREET